MQVVDVGVKRVAVACMVKFTCVGNDMKSKALLKISRLL